MHESRGAQIVDLEDYDMPPAVITKSDGSSLYATRDIAAAIYRKQHYDFYKNIYVVATQQNLHFKQWKQVLALMGYSWEKDCIHVPFGLVSLEEGTMSTRKGRVVFLEDVLNKACLLYTSYFTKINITELFITANVYDSLVVKSKYKDLKDNIDKGRLHKVCLLYTSRCV